jgi:hypothetical protein
MKVLVTVAAVTAMTLSGCGGTANQRTNHHNDTSSDTSSPPAASRTYSGTASVGDLLTLNIETTAISYTNLSNSDNGTATYNIGSDGVYMIDDLTGDPVAACEVPVYALLIEAKRTGLDHSSPSLITAVAQSTISLDTWKNHQYNYMQFRASSGGMEVGSVSMDAQGNAAANAPHLYDGSSAKPAAPYYGMFTFRVAAAVLPRTPSLPSLREPCCSRSSLPFPMPVPAAGTCMELV